MSCQHGNGTRADGSCPCSESCFCRLQGACRESDPIDVDTVALTRSDRRPTRPISPGALRLEIDLTDAKSVAEFMEAIARSVRERKRIVLMVE